MRNTALKRAGTAERALKVLQAEERALKDTASTLEGSFYMHLLSANLLLGMAISL